MYGIQDSSNTAVIPINLTEQEKTRFIELGKRTAHLIHQLKTPLSAAILYVDHLLEHAALNEPAKKWVDSLELCHASMARQLQDLLCFIKGRAVASSLTSMKDWCIRLEKRVMPFIQNNSATLFINNELDTKEVLMHEESLIGAVQNLILNALQAKASQIWVSIHKIQESWLQITIKDDGIGMSDEIRSQAMNPFFTTKTEGTGLGLSIVNSVVQAHQGKIRLDSTLGKGCSITINLPG